jgi:hypothetical protein
MADMRTALSGGYAKQMAPMIDPQGMAQNDPAQYYQKTPFMRSLWEGRLPTWLGQAYEQNIKPAWDAYEPKASDLYNAPMSMVGALGDDIANKTQSVMATDPNDPEALRQASQDSFDLAGYAAGGGFGASRLMGPKGDAILGAHVWQGGPHKYGPEGARESLKHMSKGEGAQAYGWGRYDAENPEVAKSYMSIGGEHVLRNADGKTLKPSELRAAGDESLADAVNAISSMPPDAGVKWLKEIGLPNEAAIAQKLIDDGYVGYFDDTGNIYKHDLPDEDIARYLDWDKPLSEQPESVRGNLLGALSAKANGPQEIGVGDGMPIPWNTFNDDVVDSLNEMSVSQLRKMLTSKEVIGYTDKEASEFLGKAGIPGLKYLDGMSRNAGDGTRNYVTWDQDVLNRMKLLERNGELMTDALTGNK